MAVKGSISMQLGGKSLAAVRAQIQDLKSDLRTQIQRGLREIAQQLLIDSRPFVPVLTGDLQRSGRVEVEAFSIDDFEIARVVYGSAIVAYAYRQHEEEFNHPSLGFRGAAKYLERPFALNQRYYFELFRLRLGKYLTNFQGATRGA